MAKGVSSFVWANNDEASKNFTTDQFVMPMGVIAAYLYRPE